MYDICCVILIGLMKARMQADFKLGYQINRGIPSESYVICIITKSWFLTRSLREPGGPCTKSMEVSESRMEQKPP